MTKKASVLFFLILAFYVAAETIVPAKWATPNQIRRIVKENVLALSSVASNERYPDADTVIIDSVTYESYNSDGTSVVYDDTYTKIMTEKGRRNESTASLYYNAFYGKVEIIAAEIIKEDGTTLTVDLSSHAKTMIDPGYMGSNIYDPNDKILRISYPHLQIGDIVRLAFKRTNSKARIPKVWSDYQVFETSSPLIKYTYYISSPNSLPIKRNVIRDEVPATIKYYSEPLNSDNERTLHKWDIDGVEQYFTEPNMPPAHTVCQRLLLSTADKWEDISKWYWNLSKPRLETVTDEMRKTVDEILAKSSDEEHNKIWNIYTWVSQNIRYMGVTTETEAPGYEPHNVSETFEKRYGVCRDKAALLVAMLRLASIDAYPVLIHVGEKRDKEVPMTFFNHAIVGVREKDGTYTLMDPTNENSADLLPAYLSGKSYLVATPEGETLKTSPEVPASANMVFAQSKGKIDSAGNLTLKAKIDFEGLNDSAYRGFLIRAPQEKRRQFFENAVKSIAPNATLNELKIEPENLKDTETPLSVSLLVTANDYPANGDYATALGTPWLTSALGYVNLILDGMGLEKRRFPFETENACGVDERIELSYDNSKSIIALPDSTSFKTNGITFSQSINLKQDNNKTHITAHKRFEVNQTSYSPEQYIALKETLRRIKAISGQDVILSNSKDAEKQYDICTLSTSTTLDAIDFSSWTTTVSTVKQILTYSGLKNNSELKISYCPAMEKIDILEASVSNLNGQVHYIRPEEINIMDENWVALAPRYPARKTMVLSLPAVEIGSVITTSYRRTVTNSPIFSFEYCFQSTDPILKNTFTLRSSVTNDILFNLMNELPCVGNITTNNGIEELAITVDNPPAYPREENTPPQFAHAMTLHISTPKGWEHYKKQLKEIISDGTSPENSKDCASLALELTSNWDMPQIKALNIRYYVMRKIRLAGPTFSKIPLQATPADKILVDGYGNLFDRAIVMSALLSEAGIDNRIVLADEKMMIENWNLDDYPLYKSPNPHTFTYPLVEVYFDNESNPIYFNDTNEYTAWGATTLAKHIAIAPHPCNADEESPFIQICTENMHMDMKILSATFSVDKNGDAMCTISNSYWGSLTGKIRKFYEETTPEMLSRHHQTLAGEIAIGAKPVGEISTDFESIPHVVSYSAFIPNFATKTGDILSIPLLNNKTSIPSDTNDRTLPMLLKDEIPLGCYVEIHLPPETEKILSKPESFKWHHFDLGLGITECIINDFEQNDRKVISSYFKRLQEIRMIIAPEFMKTIQELNRKIEKPSQNTILIKLAK